MKTAAQVVVMQPQAKERERFPAAARSLEKHGTNSPSDPPEETSPADTLISDWPPEL